MGVGGLEMMLCTDFGKGGVWNGLKGLEMGFLIHCFLNVCFLWAFFVGCAN